MLTILILLSLLSAIDCQNIAMSLCDALQDNGGTIGYSMSIPTGTDHRKYLIVKDRFWEVEYKTNASETIGGELKLKKRFSKRVNFFHTEENHDKYFNFGFGAKFIDKRVNVNHWNQTIIALINMDANLKLNETLVRMELVYPNFDDLPLEDTVNMWDYKADTSELVTNYKNFRPHLVFQSFSNQEETYSMLIEQKLTGQDNPKYKLKMDTSRITNSTLSAKKLIKRQAKAMASIPQSVEKVLGFYSVKGLFGVSFPNAPEDKRNGTIFFIEICDTPVTSNGCKGQKTLVYCMASETDSDPLADDQNCAFGSTQNRLFDCLGPEPPPEETTTEATPPPPPPPPPPQDNSQQTPTPTKEEGGGMWWIIVLIVVILLIIGALLLAFLLMRKSSKADDEIAKAGASPSKQGGPESSTRSRDSTAPGAVPPSTVDSMTSTRSTAGPNGPKAGPQSTLGPMNSTRSKAPNAPDAPNTPAAGPQSTLEPMTSTRSSAPNSPNSPTAGPTAGPTSTLEPTNSTRSKASNAPNAPPGGPQSTLEPTTSTTSTRSTASNR